MRSVSTIGSGLEIMCAGLKVRMEREDKVRSLKQSLDCMLPAEAVRFLML